jgi:hypothetical protein
VHAQKEGPLQETLGGSNQEKKKKKKKKKQKCQ